MLLSILLAEDQFVGMYVNYNFVLISNLLIQLCCSVLQGFMVNKFPYNMKYMYIEIEILFHHRM